MELVMTIDMHAIPHFLVLRGRSQSYVLNKDRLLLRREASHLLGTFAKACGKPMSIEDMLWDTFSQTEGFSMTERERACSYTLVHGSETEHQLRLLSSL
jgi:hypothetical protein